MYATADDMRARFGEQDLVQLTDAPAWDVQATSRINLKLADATAIADGYVAKYYAPAAGIAVPPLLVQIVCDIAYAELFQAPPEAAKARSDRAMKMLVDISKGMIKLDGGDVEQLAPRDGAILVEDPGRVFSRDSLRGF